MSVKTHAVFFGNKRMKKYWTNSAITLAAFAGVDFFIATKLTSNEGDAWLLFVVLMIVPIVFSIKSAIIRAALWKLFIKKDVVDQYTQMFIAGEWPKPNNEFEDAEDYLLKVIDDKECNEATRIEAAKFFGYVRSLYESQQVVSALQTSSALKAAMIRYEGNFQN